MKEVVDRAVQDLILVYNALNEEKKNKLELSWAKLSPY